MLSPMPPALFWILSGSSIFTARWSSILRKEIGSSRNLIDVLKGNLELEKLLSGRARADAEAQPKVEVATRVRFDSQSSSHSTLLELVAQDRPGLLFDVSSVLADQGCNIEIALIDTEGQRAIDVFYLTYRGAKLDCAKQEAVGKAFSRGCED